MTVSYVVFMVSCAKDIVDLTGDIRGTVKDYESGHLLENCRVSLSPGGLSQASSASGTYEFSSLEPGDYSLTFSKAGYEDQQATVRVIMGNTTVYDVLLKAKAPFALSEDKVDFGDLDVTKQVFIFNNSDSDCTFNVSNVPSWLSLNKNHGTISAFGNESLAATVNREDLSVGEYNQNLTISYSGKSSGAVILSVRVKKVVLSSPTVTIASNGVNIKETSFDIEGAITSTGGSQIISYGHCWSRYENPTVNDSKSDLGVTTSVGSFVTTATDLATYTTYYVRAYAVNAQGIAYSNQIAITTQDVSSDKWDGNKASSYEGGSGTSVDPYIIKTGGQLLLIKDNPDKYYVLGGNIDLDGKNWLPYRFDGNIDGKGFSISNLVVNRPDDNQGLFSECYGKVSNLTIKNVAIKASQNNYVGAFSGRGGTFSNCHLLLGSNSEIMGNEFVGGFSGGDAILSDCSVLSTATTPVIKGNTYVGGLVGGITHSTCSIKNCKVNVDITGALKVGGLIGFYDHSSDNKTPAIVDCEYLGTISAEGVAGGILGYGSKGYPTITSCKVEADITATDGSAGGLIGCDENSLYYGYIYACYTTGKITAAELSGGLLGTVTNKYNAERRAYLSYSTMISTSSSFYGLGKYVQCFDCATTGEKDSDMDNTNTQVQCEDILKHFRESYSEYVSYWNFGSEWVWEGRIGNKSVKVNCPRLSWE